MAYRGCQVPGLFLTVYVYLVSLHVRHLEKSQCSVLDFIPISISLNRQNCPPKWKPNSSPLSLQVYPEVKDSNQACLPPSSFITCSSDNTIRLWNTESSGVHGSTLHRNILSNVSQRLGPPFHIQHPPCLQILTLFSGTSFPSLDYSAFVWLGPVSQGLIFTQQSSVLQLSCWDCLTHLFLPSPRISLRSSMWTGTLRLFWTLSYLEETKLMGP